MSILQIKEGTVEIKEDTFIESGRTFKEINTF